MISEKAHSIALEAIDYHQCSPASKAARKALLCHFRALEAKKAIDGKGIADSPKELENENDGNNFNIAENTKP